MTEKEKDLIETFRNLSKEGRKMWLDHGRPRVEQTNTGLSLPENPGGGVPGQLPDMSVRPA